MQISIFLVVLCLSLASSETFSAKKFLKDNILKPLAKEIKNNTQEYAKEKLIKYLLKKDNINLILLATLIRNANSIKAEASAKRIGKRDSAVFKRINSLVNRLKANKTSEPVIKTNEPVIKTNEPVIYHSQPVYFRKLDDYPDIARGYKASHLLMSYRRRRRSGLFNKLASTMDASQAIADNLNSDNEQKQVESPKDENQKRAAVTRLLNNILKFKRKNYMFRNLPLKNISIPRKTQEFINIPVLLNGKQGNAGVNGLADYYMHELSSSQKQYRPMSSKEMKELNRYLMSLVRRHKRDLETDANLSEDDDTKHSPSDKELNQQSAGLIEKFYTSIHESEKVNNNGVFDNVLTLLNTYHSKLTGIMMNANVAK